MAQQLGGPAKHQDSVRQHGSLAPVGDQEFSRPYSLQTLRNTTWRSTCSASTGLNQ